uniref:ATP-binding protein n=1 Tax=Desulforadius tongensis TaxID=1216062 RepID=UPI003B75C84F
MFQVISDCYERKSLIITTNLEFSKWNGIFYDEKLTSAIIDRVIHHSHLLIFTGSSYRLENSTINCQKCKLGCCKNLQNYFAKTCIFIL